MPDDAAGPAGMRSDPTGPFPEAPATPQAEQDEEPPPPADDSGADSGLESGADARAARDDTTSPVYTTEDEDDRGPLAPVFREPPPRTPPGPGR